MGQLNATDLRVELREHRRVHVEVLDSSRPVLAVYEGGRVSKPHPLLVYIIRTGNGGAKLLQNDT